MSEHKGLIAELRFSNSIARGFGPEPIQDRAADTIETLSAENTALRERVKELERALGNIAKQKKTLELETEYDVECADFEGGYDAIIDAARAALKGGDV